MNYSLNKNTEDGKEQEGGVLSALKKLLPLMADEKKNLILAAVAIFFNSALNLAAPVLVGYTIDKYIQTRQYHGVLVFSAILLVMYVAALVASYIQTKLMGGVGQRVLFNLRNAIFNKLQELPVAFFNQNQAGDLISRINNDTDKLNQFFSQALMQFIGSIFLMLGAGIFLLVINVRLGAAALAPAALLVIFTQLISPWVKRKNAINLKTVGGMSAEIQESLNNFKVIVAFNRRDYFRQRFEEVNKNNYSTAITAGIANNIFTPIYGLSSNIAQLIVLSYGIYLITTGHFTLGLLISFLSYVTRFYDPLRQLAALWANFQVALAGWDRIAAILSLHSDLAIVPSQEISKTSSVLEFSHVSFAYPDGKQILTDINFHLERGKTYALVGPTGGGKTTTASLMARLYDPTQGRVLLNGKDIRSFNPQERAQKIGFILQEPFLFTGTLRENILYGNDRYKNYSTEQLMQVLSAAGLENLLSRFDQGLEAKVLSSGDGLSLGQKQLIAFIRAVLRNPELLILDEATANIDTVTEQLLEEILQKLPKETTRVIIAHRLNTIENADEIFFVNAGTLTLAGSMDHAVEMLMHGKRES
jgi:ATP-binding cassette subfamily B protein